MVGRHRRRTFFRVPIQIERLERRELLSVTPKDPYYDEQYSLQTSNAQAAWAVTTGSAATTVGVIDTGLDYTHEDLYENVWINQAEIPPSIKPQLRDTDNDGRITFYDLNNPANAGLTQDLNHNGYIDAGDLLRPISQGGWDDGINGLTYAGDTHVDDIIGWDFAGNDNNPLDSDGHGTHVAGIIGARGDNGVGVAGVTWKISMMAVRIFGDSGNSVSDSRIAQAIRYAVDAGASVMNASWGGSFTSTPLESALSYANSRDRVFVTSAGNDGVNDDYSSDASFPAAYNDTNVIAVAATTRTGELASYSNFGTKTVDIAAPGSRILSTYNDGDYRYLSGTSMAAPFVTGTVALMLSANPNLTAKEIRTLLVDNAIQSSALASTNASHGRIDVGNTVRAAVGATQPVSSTRIAVPAGPDLPYSITYYEQLPGYSNIPTPIASFTPGDATSGSSSKGNGAWNWPWPFATASAIVDSTADPLNRRTTWQKTAS